MITVDGHLLFFLFCRQQPLHVAQCRRVDLLCDVLCHLCDLLGGFRLAKGQDLRRVDEGGVVCGQRAGLEPVCLRLPDGFPDRPDKSKFIGFPV